MRCTGFAAVLLMAESAGTIASSKGNASVTPIPRRKVLRGSAILVMIMTEISYIRNLSGSSRISSWTGRRRCDCRGGPCHGDPHLKRRALDDAHDQCGHAVVGRGGIAGNPAYGRRI